VNHARVAPVICLLLIVSFAAFADSITSVNPPSYYLYDVEEFVTLQGVNLIGNITTQCVVSGPAGSFTRDWSGGFHDPATGIDTVYLAIPDQVLMVAGHYSITVIATDDTGVRTIGPASFDVVARSVQQPPLLAMPEAVFAEATGPSGANVTFGVGGYSFVAPSPTISCDHASGSMYPLDVTTVTCTASDSAGTTSGSFEIYVTDTVAPIVHVPADIASSTEVVTFTATATDAIDGSIAVTCSPASGDRFPPGVTTVICSATDAHANSAFASFHVTATLPNFTVSQSVYQLNPAASGTVTYTSVVPYTLTETITIRSVQTSAIVRTLVSQQRSAATYTDVWNGTNDAGALVPDGAYQYVATATTASGTVTWDQSTQYVGGATQVPYGKCRNSTGALVACNDSSILFDPFTNQPLRINYCVGGGDPPSCTGATPAIVVVKASGNAEADASCNAAECIANEYQSGGAHEIAWYGRTAGLVDVSYAPYLAVIRRDDNWPKNVALVFGTNPSISNVAISSAMFNPASATSIAAGLDVSFDVATFQSRTVTTTCQFRNTGSGSILRTITLASQAAGHVTVHWNGRADNGDWVAPNVYEIILTTTDSAGGAATVRPLVTVRY
jgi:flagellar hook assembly protein FlgD